MSRYSPEHFSEDLSDIEDLSDLSWEVGNAAAAFQVAVDEEIFRQEDQVRKEQAHALEPAIAAAVAMYQVRRAQRMRLFGIVISGASAAVHAYVRWSGGIQKMRRFQIPDVSFSYESMDDKECQVPSSPPSSPMFYDLLFQRCR